MKRNKVELDVDFIAGQQPLTTKEQKELSDHILAYKQKKNKVSTAKRKIISTKNKLVHS